MWRHPPRSGRPIGAVQRALAACPMPRCVHPATRRLPCARVPSLSLQAFSLVIIYRCWPLLTPLTAAWLLASLAIAAADVCLQRLSWDTYVRWRELPAALLAFNAFGPPAAWLLMRQLLDDHGASAALDAGGSGSCSQWGAAVHAAAHLARILFASGAAKMAANSLSLRTRLRCGSVRSIA